MRITPVLLRAGTWIRRSSPLRRLEPLWARVEPRWNAALDRASRSRGIGVTVNGDRLRLTPSYAAYHASRGFEPEMHAALAQTLEPGDCVLDVGAHVGLFTLAAALRVGPTGRVICFEASPATVATLRRHVAMNGFGDRVAVVSAAAADVEGELTFFVGGETMSASLTRASVEELRPGHEDAPTFEIREIRVPAVTLDGYCARERVEPTHVKIDVEGAELRVLRGAEGILRGTADVVCEVHPAQLEAAGGSEEELAAFVAHTGRALVTIDEREDGIYHARLARR